MFKRGPGLIKTGIGLRRPCARVGWANAMGSSYVWKMGLLVRAGYTL